MLFYIRLRRKMSPIETYLWQKGGFSLVQNYMLILHYKIRIEVYLIFYPTCVGSGLLPPTSPNGAPEQKTLISNLPLKQSL